MSKNISKYLHQQMDNEAGKSYSLAKENKDRDYRRTFPLPTALLVDLVKQV